MFESIMVVVAVVVGLAIGIVIGKFMQASREKERFAEQERSYKEDLFTVRQQVTQLQAENTTLERSLQNERDVEGYLKSQIERFQRQEQQRLEQEKQALVQSNQQEQDQALAKKDEENAILKSIAPVAERLDKLCTIVDTMKEKHATQISAFSEELKTLTTYQDKLYDQTKVLATALKDNSVRGAWGEAQLRNIVEAAGLLEHVDFDTQVVLDNESKIRPDMIIHLPGKKSLVVDSKVPYSYYEQACTLADASVQQDVQRRNELLQLHAKALKAHIQKLNKTSYQSSHTLITPDFVIAFIPNETLLEAALRADPTLLNFAFQNNVALTSPVTLWAVLKSVAYAWQQQVVTEDVKRIFDVSQELHSRFAKVGDSLESLGKNIEKTVQQYNKFVGSFETRVLSSARKLDKIDPVTTIAQLEPLDPDKTQVRGVSASELFEERQLLE